MGEGFVSNKYPSPIIAHGSTELPSPARGEGDNSGDRARGPAVLVVAVLTMSNSPSRSRGAFLRPGFATSLHSPRTEGWAERRETFGCVRGTRGRAHNAAYQALARRLASHDAGRSPLGAPPWRFWAPGPRFSHRHLRRIGYNELLAPRS